MVEKRGTHRFRIGREKTSEQVNVEARVLSAYVLCCTVRRRHGHNKGLRGIIFVHWRIRYTDVTPLLQPDGMVKRW